MHSYERVMSHNSASTRTRGTHLPPPTNPGSSSHTWMSHVTHIHESCQTCCMSHVWCTHGMHFPTPTNPCLIIAHTIESCHLYAGVMSGMSHVNPMEDTWYVFSTTHEPRCIMAHTDASCHTYT